MHLTRYTAAGMLCIGLAAAACVSNPFGGDEVRGEKRSLTGQVTLLDGASAENTFIWLEGYNFGTRADAQGEFTLTLPAAPTGNSTVAANGVFTLYLYLANYRLLTKQVVVTDGEFVYNRADLGRDGALNGPLSLKRHLHVRTSISPARVPQNYSGTLTATVTLQAVSDSVTVVFPGTTGGMLGAILLQKLGSSQVFIYRAVPGLITAEIETIGLSPRQRSMGFGIAQKPLPPGTYEVIPHVLVAHEKIPAALLASLGTDVTALTPNYLNIPFRRDSATLQVMN